METGHICQMELRLADLAAGLDFYRQAFDWRLEPVGPSYVIADTGREPLVGLMQRPDENVPVGASPYVLVDDLAPIQARCRDLGAHVFVDATEMPGQGTFFILLDPWDNEIAFWQPVSGWHAQYQGSGANGFVWMEIPVPDLGEGVRFYTELCDWSFQIQPGTEHLAFVAEPDRALGIGLISGPEGQPMVGTTPYIHVADLYEAMERVVAAGGRIAVQPEGSPGGGRFAVFLDPSNVRLGLFEAASSRDEP